MGRRGSIGRQDVLEALQQSAGPLTAYDILRELRAENPKLAPMTIYRALSTLRDHGRVLRIESLNAYIACHSDIHHTDTILAICDACGAVEERAAPGLLTQLSKVVSKTGFAPTRHVVEIHGLCRSCSDEPTSQ